MNQKLIWPNKKEDDQPRRKPRWHKKRMQKNVTHLPNNGKEHEEEEEEEKEGPIKW